MATRENHWFSKGRDSHLPPSPASAGSLNRPPPLPPDPPDPLHFPPLNPHSSTSSSLSSSTSVSTSLSTGSSTSGVAAVSAPTKTVSPTGVALTTAVDLESQPMDLDVSPTVTISRSEPQIPGQINVPLPQSSTLPSSASAPEGSAPLPSSPKGLLPLPSSTIRAPTQIHKSTIHNPTVQIPNPNTNPSKPSTSATHPIAPSVHLPHASPTDAPLTGGVNNQEWVLVGIST